MEIQDEALVAAAKLSGRYIPGGQSFPKQAHANFILNVINACFFFPTSAAFSGQGDRSCGRGLRDGETDDGSPEEASQKQRQQPLGAQGRKRRWPGPRSTGTHRIAHLHSSVIDYLKFGKLHIYHIFVL
jgi:hypothetical protein